MTSIAFICTANRCRSVMAHAVCSNEVSRRGLSLQIYSAGVYDFTDLPPVNDTVTTCDNFQTPVPKEESTWAANLPLDSIDHFLVMEQHHVDVLVEEFGVALERISFLSEFDPQDRGKQIADPIGRGRAVYDECYRRIRDCVIEYLDTNDTLRR